MDIQIQINRQYRGYKTGLSVNGLNNFVVLTGLNGAGKSQLLQILEAKSFMRQPNPQAVSSVSKNGVQVSKEKILGIFDWSMPPAPPAGQAEKQTLTQEIYNEIISNLPPRNQSFNQRFSLEQHNALVELSRIFAAEGRTPEDPPTIDNVLERLPEDLEKLSSQILNERIASIVHDWHFKHYRQEIDPNKDPINIFNKICEEFGTTYRLPPFGRYEVPYQPMLINESGDTVNWNEMSSGEQILFRIICWLFYYKIDKAVYPEVMLLDEPDAHLTPKMIHKFLKNLKDTLIDKMGIAVIMTTHSPNTVALCDEPALYELICESGNREIRSISREDALTKFAEGLLFVQAENKLVFVEGSADKPFYTSLHQIAINAHGFETIPGLSFIAASNANPDNGGCTQVTQMIPRFSGTTLESLVFGIIDSDNSNEPQYRIGVIDRYSIENYIYDPLILAVNLIIQGKHLGILDESHEIGIGEYNKIFSNPLMTQTIVDEIVSIMESAARSEIDSSGHGYDKIAVKWIIKDSKVVTYDLPVWFLKMKKKDLLQKVIHNSANPIKDHADYTKQIIAIQTLAAVPSPILDLFKAIQDNSL